MRTVICALLVVALVVAGCGDDDDAATTPTTRAASGSDEAATNEGADFEVQFDGEVCTVTGPDSVPVGRYTFVLTDTSDLGVDLYVDAYADGYTYAEHEEFIEDAGGDGARGLDRPDWAPEALRIYGAPTLELEENQTRKDYRLESGPHGAVMNISGGGGVWGCGGFDVT